MPERLATINARLELAKEQSKNNFLSLKGMTIPESHCTIDFTSQYEKEETVLVKKTKSGLIHVCRELALTSRQLDYLFLIANYGLETSQIAEITDETTNAVRNHLLLARSDNQALLEKMKFSTKTTTGLVTLAEVRGLLSQEFRSGLRSKLIPVSSI